MDERSNTGGCLCKTVKEKDERERTADDPDNRQIKPISDRDIFKMMTIARQKQDR